MSGPPVPARSRGEWAWHGDVLFLMLVAMACGGLLVGALLAARVVGDERDLGVLLIVGGALTVYSVFRLSQIRRSTSSR
jgi:hypothetical protein